VKESEPSTAQVVGQWERGGKIHFLAGTWGGKGRDRRKHVLPISEEGMKIILSHLSSWHVK